nr:MAG TPA: hypothetical protein [Caudoviricetes sp.]
MTGMSLNYQGKGRDPVKSVADGGIYEKKRN